MNKEFEMTHGGYTYGVIQDKYGYHFEYEIKEDSNGKKYKGWRCSDYGNFNDMLQDLKEDKNDNN
jgi:hypothetical protein